MYKDIEIGETVKQRPMKGRRVGTTTVVEFIRPSELWPNGELAKLADGTTVHASRLRRPGEE